VDRNLDGEVNKREMILALRKEPRLCEMLGLPSHIHQEDGSREAFELLFQGADHDDDRCLSWSEFAECVESRRMTQAGEGVSGGGTVDSSETNELDAGSLELEQQRQYQHLTSTPMDTPEQSMDTPPMATPALHMATPAAVPKARRSLAISASDESSDAAVPYRIRLEHTDGTFSGFQKASNGIPTGTKEGYGVYQFADGMRYEGEFSGGKRHGSGVYYYPSGASFTGEWCNGKRISGRYEPAPLLAP
jgi:hypothetical protein